MSLPFPFVGELAALGAAVCWSISTCIYRRHAGLVPAYALNLSKIAVATTGLGLVALFARLPLPSDPWVWASLTGSGVFGIALSDTAAFAALKRLGAPLAAAGICLDPPLVSLIALLFLGEHLTTSQAMGAAITVSATAGVVFFGNRGRLAAGVLSSREATVGVSFLVLTGLFHSVGVVLGRYGMQRADVVTGTLIRLIPAGLVLLIPLWRDRREAGPWLTDRKRLRYLGIAGLIGSLVGVFLMSVGLKYAKAGVAGSLLATFPLWVIPLAHRFLHERVDPKSAACTLLAVLGVILLVCSGNGGL